MRPRQYIVCGEFLGGCSDRGQELPHMGPILEFPLRDLAVSGQIDNVDPFYGGPELTGPMVYIKTYIVNHFY